MASSIVDPLQEHITCSICFEIYDKPECLKCLHTFCHQCILALRDGDRIQCPSCRRYTHIDEVQNEFKVQGMIDLHNQLKDRMMTNKPSTSAHFCETCKVPNKKMEFFCKNCQEAMCVDCSKAHRGSKATRDHKLTAHSELHEEKREIVRQELGKLHENMKLLCTALEGNAMTLDKIHAQVKQATEQINRERNEIKSQVDAHHDKLLKELNQHYAEKKEILKESSAFFASSKSDLEAKIHNLSGISESDDVTLLDDTIISLQEETRQSLLEVQSHLVQVNTTLKSPVTVQKGAKWKPSTSTCLQWPKNKAAKKIASEVSRSEEQPITTGQEQSSGKKKNSGSKQGNAAKATTLQLTDFNTTLHKGTYTKTTEKKIAFPLRKLCYAKKQLWCAAGYNGIVVYDLNCKHLRHIQKTPLTNVISLAKTSVGDVVIDGHMGLLFYRDSNYQDNNKMTIIENRVYADLAVAKDSLFALDEL